jgi:hypothetical protein
MAHPGPPSLRHCLQLLQLFIMINLHHLIYNIVHVISITACKLDLNLRPRLVCGLSNPLEID